METFLPQPGPAGGWRPAGVREDEELAGGLEEVAVSALVRTVLAWPTLAHQPAQVQAQPGPRAWTQGTEQHILSKMN